MVTEFHMPEEVLRWVPPLPWLRVRRSSTARLKAAGRELRLDFVRLPSSLQDESLLPRAVERSGRGAAIPVVLSPFLRRRFREYLEGRDISYLDSQGHLHLVAPGVLIHIEGPAAAPKSPESGRLGVDGVRTVQSALEQQEPLSVSRLAERASVSVGQAHKVLTLLERAGLVQSTGRGPSRRRLMPNRTAVLEWLQQQPAAVRRAPRCDLALYARRPEELWARMSAELGRAGIAHALTGAAAASLYGVGPTSVPRSLVRISPEVPLERVAQVLGAEVTERGPNLTLVRDTGQVGCWGAVERQGIQVAPAVRIYLDARSERRGEDVAMQFREVVLGY